MWCQSCVETTQVRPTSRTSRRVVIRGKRHLQRPLAGDHLGVEVAGGAERLGAEELVDPGRPAAGRGTSPTCWRGTSSWGGWRSSAAGSAPRPGGGSTSRSSPAACTPGRCSRRSRPRPRRGTGSGSRPTSSSRSGRPWRSSAGRRASPCSRRRATGSAGAQRRDPVVGDVEVVVRVVVAQPVPHRVGCRGSTATGRSARRAPAGPGGRRRSACTGSERAGLAADRARGPSCGPAGAGTRPTRWKTASRIFCPLNQT